MIIKDEGSTIGTVGGGQVEFTAIREGVEAIKTGTPKLLEFELKESEGLLCGGRMKIFIEPILTDPHLYIFGGGHVGQALSKIASTAGFEVTVIEEREKFITRERFPEAEELILGRYEKIIPNLPLNQNSYIVIATHSHKLDEIVLKGCLKRDYNYIGMVASKEKAKTIFHRLMEEGSSRERLKEVRAPIGLAIGSQTPGEIAISIMAEIISFRNSRGKGV